MLINAFRNPFFYPICFYWNESASMIRLESTVSILTHQADRKESGDSRSQVLVQLLE